VPMATASQSPTHARNFVLRALAWSLGLFGVLRLPWVEAHAVLPLTQFQGRLAEAGFGIPPVPVQITLACSGADACALCVGAVLAYPVPWSVRLRGAAGGMALILVLNTLRIGTLGRVAGSPSWFEALHVYVWPALLTIAIAVYVFGWMLLADKPRADAAPRTSRAPAASSAHPLVTRRFIVLTGAFIVLFTAAGPLYLESPRVLAVAAFIAQAAAATLHVLGVHASVTDNVLWTARGGFAVTQECISTPLIPVYLAGVFAYSTSFRRRALALAAAGPLFVGLGIVRLLVVALPTTLVSSPMFLVHAFYQLLLAAVVVVLAAFWRQGAGANAWRRAILGGALGVAIVYLLGPPYTRALTSAFAAGVPLNDPQGAIALLPAFQIGLYVALSIAAFVVLQWRPFVTGLGLLGLSQIAVFAALHFGLRYAEFTPDVRDIRAWALAGPLLVVAAMVTYDRPRQ
jgi:exosortase/archaeosortase family protein